MSPLISVQHLGKIYRSGKLEVHALRDVSFTVEQGEFVAIVGPSGSGKSTLFHLLGGLTQATSGSVEIGGVDLAPLSDADRTRLRRREIGFVFQTFNLLARATSLHNVELPLIYAGIGSGERHEKAKQALASVDLADRMMHQLATLMHIEGRMDHRPSELSGGEQQRVAIARALINRPSIVLADEPTGNLDTENSHTVLTMLERSVRELHQTVLMITHKPEAAGIADRILHMRDGRITHVEQRRPVAASI